MAYQNYTDQLRDLEVEHWYDARALRAQLIHAQVLGTQVLSNRAEIKNAISSCIVQRPFAEDLRFPENRVLITPAIGMQEQFTRLFAGLNSKVRFFTDRAEGTEGEKDDNAGLRQTMDASRSLDTTIAGLLQNLRDGAHGLDRARFEQRFGLVWVPAPNAP